MGNPDKETQITSVDPLKASAAFDSSSKGAKAYVQSQSCVTVLHPHILHETDDFNPSYRLDCPKPGLFQCSATGLMFEMEKQGEVYYKTVDWDNLLYTSMPAGPLFSINCPQHSVRQLHLPHCETLSDYLFPDDLLVAHVKMDGKMEELRPNHMTTTHVIVNITELSWFGLFRKWFSFLPVPSQVLIFLRRRANTQKYILNVFLLPKNVPVLQVESQQRGSMYIQTNSNCTLSPRGSYSLCCEMVAQADILPKSGKFDCDYSRNYHPTFQVYLNSEAETVRLNLMDRRNNDQKVWECQVPLAGFEEPQNLPTLDVPAEFVRNKWNALIQRVTSVLHIADDLVDEVISRETYNNVRHMETSQMQMRELLTAVLAAGATAASKFCIALKQCEPMLAEDLGVPDCSHR